jgi:hypothetical protein
MALRSLRLLQLSALSTSSFGLHLTALVEAAGTLVGGFRLNVCPPLIVTAGSSTRQGPIVESKQLPAPGSCATRSLPLERPWVAPPLASANSLT